MRRGSGKASVCHGLPSGKKIRSAKCQSHQWVTVWHMMSKGFQNYISQLKKKIRGSSLISFYSFCNLCKKLFLMWMRLNRRHMLSNFCHAAKLQCVAFCHAAQRRCTFRIIRSSTMSNIWVNFFSKINSYFDLLYYMHIAVILHHAPPQPRIILSVCNWGNYANIFLKQRHVRSF